jgi:hypothetical protein
MDNQFIFLLQELRQYEHVGVDTVLKKILAFSDGIIR